MITKEQADTLYAMGYRPETSPPRAVLRQGLPGVYVTLDADTAGQTHWAVWTNKRCRKVSEGATRNPLTAAQEAADWITGVWQ